MAEGAKIKVVFRGARKGDHVHIRVFIGAYEQGAFSPYRGPALAGSLVLSHDEYAALEAGAVVIETVTDEEPRNG